MAKLKSKLSVHFSCMLTSLPTFEACAFQNHCWYSISGHLRRIVEGSILFLLFWIANHHNQTR